MIKCKICNHETKYRLIEHIQKIHKMDIEIYKKEYGEIVSDEYKEKVSKKSKEKWENDEYRKKTMESREYIYTDPEIKEKHRNSIKKFYDNGGKTWNNGLTKENDERLVSIGKKNKENLTGRKKEDYEYLMKHSEYMKSIFKTMKVWKNWESIQKDPVEKEKWGRKISETITNKILNGEINTMSSFNCGWYEKNNDKFWHSSQLELDSMILMDKYNLEWTNSHKIKIKYIKDDVEHYYIPDFLIKINNLEYIIEMKGFDWDGDTELKSEYIKKEYDNYFIFYNINELENFLKNILKT